MACQGVLLLNTVLTVRAHQANSHRGSAGNSLRTRQSAFSMSRTDPLYFCCGKAGTDEAFHAEQSQTSYFEALHPSPLSAYRGFFGCRHFSRTNEFLKEQGAAPIDWQIENV